MTISAEPLIYGLIFVAVLLLVEGIYLTVFGKSISLNSRVNRRLEMLEKGAGREQVLEQLRKEMSQHMRSRSIPIYSIDPTTQKDREAIDVERDTVLRRPGLRRVSDTADRRSRLAGRLP